MTADVRPRWVLGENVPGIRGRGADEVLGDLEALGYACWPLVVAAADVGAPHERARVWFVGLNVAGRSSRLTRRCAARPHRRWSRDRVQSPNDPCRARRDGVPFVWRSVHALRPVRRAAVGRQSFRSSNHTPTHKEGRHGLLPSLLRAICPVNRGATDKRSSEQRRAERQRRGEGVVTTTRIIVADVRDALASLPEASFDAVFSDPPYGLSFMGKAWDHDVPGPEVWAACRAACKPGAPLLAFGGTRTWHWLAVGVEQAGWDIRDCLMWLYGSGFPKSLDVSKAIDKAAGAAREKVAVGKAVKRMIPGADQNSTGSWIKDNGRLYQPGFEHPATDAALRWAGYGTALKPAWEPIILARAPLDGTVAANALAHGVGGINVDGCRIAGETVRCTRNIALGSSGSGVYGGADKPGVFESHPEGRWPANVLLDEEAAAALDAQSGTSASGQQIGERGSRPGGFGSVGAAKGGSVPCGPQYGDSGGASRFFKVTTYEEIERWERLANCVGLPSSLGSDGSASVLARVVERATPGSVLRRLDCQEPSTSVTAREFATVCELVTTLILSTARRFSLGLPPTRLTATAETVSVVADPEPTGTTTITVNLSRSDGSAGRATFSITLPSAVRGASDSVPSRAFYTAKAGASDRVGGNTHPTVKPADLTGYLAKLILPPPHADGSPRRLLVPFCGSGGEIVGALNAGWEEVVGIEISPEYAAMAERRIRESVGGLFNTVTVEPLTVAQPTQAEGGAA